MDYYMWRAADPYFYRLTSLDQSISLVIMPVVEYLIFIPSEAFIANVMTIEPAAVAVSKYHGVIRCVHYCERQYI